MRLLHVVAYVAMVLCLTTSCQEPIGDSGIKKLQKEPVSMFDAGMARLQSDFLMGHDYDEDWFRREYRGIDFTIDIAMYWPSKERIMIHRHIKATANLANCTIAIETLRSDIAGVKGADGFIEEYFWHHRETPPAWVKNLADSVYLVGEVYDPKADETGSQTFFECESGLKEKEVKIIEKRRTYG